VGTTWAPAAPDVSHDLPDHAIGEDATIAGMRGAGRSRSTETPRHLRRRNASARPRDSVPPTRSLAAVTAVAVHRHEELPSLLHGFESANGFASVPAGGRVPPRHMVGVAHRYWQAAPGSAQAAATSRGLQAEDPHHPPWLVWRARSAAKSAAAARRRGRRSARRPTTGTVAADAGVDSDVLLAVGPR